MLEKESKRDHVMSLLQHSQDSVLTLHPDDRLAQAGGCRDGFGRGESSRDGLFFFVW